MCSLTSSYSMVYGILAGVVKLSSADQVSLVATVVVATRLTSKINTVKPKDSQSDPEES